LATAASQTKQQAMQTFYITNHITLRRQCLEQAAAHQAAILIAKSEMVESQSSQTCNSKLAEMRSLMSAHGQYACDTLSCSSQGKSKTPWRDIRGQVGSIQRIAHRL
jgi:hypothetical protein